MLKKFSLEWAFEACLEAEQEPLRLKLKPLITAWSVKTYPVLLWRLKNDPLSNNSTALEVFSTQVSGRRDPLWLFVSMCVNRTMPSDCAVAVGTTKRFAEILCNCFQEVQQEREGSFIQNG